MCGDRNETFRLHCRSKYYFDPNARVFTRLGRSMSANPSVHSLRQNSHWAVSCSCRHAASHHAKAQRELQDSRTEGAIMLGSLWLIDVVGHWLWIVGVIWSLGDDWKPLGAWSSVPGVLVSDLVALVLSLFWSRCCGWWCSSICTLWEGRIGVV